MKTIVVASQNKHKIEEIKKIISKYGYTAISRDEAGVPNIEVEEDGDTFEENSYKKAYEIMKLSGCPAIADDSGLEVEYLAGAPGVHSARFAGEHADDNANNQKLIALLAEIPEKDRRAKFVSVITLIYPDESVITARGECSGYIVTQARGENGFGYDPHFVPDGYAETFAELTAEEKNKISHRARALEALERKLSNVRK